MKTTLLSLLLLLSCTTNVDAQDRHYQDSVDKFIRQRLKKIIKLKEKADTTVFAYAFNKSTRKLVAASVHDSLCETHFFYDAEQLVKVTVRKPGEGKKIVYAVYYFRKGMLVQISDRPMKDPQADALVGQSAIVRERAIRLFMLRE